MSRPSLFHLRPPRPFSALLFVGVAALSGCLDDGDLDLDLDSTAQEITTTQLFASTSLARGASKTGSYTATETGTLTFKTAGTGDADLYVKRGTGASTTVFDCKS